MGELQERLKGAWHVLQGRPLIYRVTFEGEIKLPDPERLWVLHCEFHGVPEPSLWAIIKGRIRNWIPCWKARRQAKRFHRQRRKHAAEARAIPR